MLSRVADSLYWMGRYLERAENITRLLLVTEDFSTETQGLAEDLAQTAWKDMLEIFPSAQLTRAITPFAPLSVPYLSTFFTDQANAYSINFSIRKARENARSVREALTLEVFLALNEVFRSVEAYERKGMPDLPAFRDALGAIHKGIFTVVGAIEHTSTHDEGWRFLKLGESLERSYRSALVLRTRLPALLAAEARGDAPSYALRDFLAFGGPVKLTPTLRAAHRAIGLTSTAPIGEQVVALGTYIRERFEYRKNVTAYDSTTEDFLKIGGGVCQDFAHLMLGLLRLREIPCRYVSGYLHVERKTREPSQSHAWVEFHSPTAGWVPFDPTHNRPVDERYVVVGHGRHYDDVPPNKGIYRGIAKESLKAEVVTEVVPGKIVSTLREEISHIDLPVFREIPARPPDRIVTNVADVGIQQQQQQQQQCSAPFSTTRYATWPWMRRRSSRGSRTRWKISRTPPVPVSVIEP